VSKEIRKILRLRSQAAAMRVLAAEAPTATGRETMQRLAEKLESLAHRTEAAAAFAALATTLAEVPWLH